MTQPGKAKIRVFHRTASAEAILREGFRDGHGTYLTGEAQSGVFVSDVPVDMNEGAYGEQLLVLELSEEVLAPYEFVDLSGMWNLFREWCVPAEVLNTAQAHLLVGSALEEAESAAQWDTFRRGQAVERRRDALGMSLEDAMAKADADPDWTLWPDGAPWRQDTWAER